MMNPHDNNHEGRGPRSGNFEAFDLHKLRRGTHTCTWKKVVQTKRCDLPEYHSRNDRLLQR